MGQQCHHSVQEEVKQIIEHINEPENEQVRVEIQILRKKNIDQLKTLTTQTKQGIQFKGYVKNKLKQGYGQLKMQKDKRYYGYFKDDLPHIKGVLQFSSNHHYIGQFQKGEFHGYGRQVSPHFTFQGQYEKGQKKYGILKTQQFSYDGSFQNGMFGGYGQLAYTNGEKYIGYFINSQFQGQGMYFYDKKLVYQGFFKNNFYHGHGKYYWQDGSYYQGAYQQGYKHGNGKYIKGNTLISGNWTNGQLTMKLKSFEIEQLMSIKQF